MTVVVLVGTVLIGMYRYSTWLSVVSKQPINNNAITETLTLPRRVFRLAQENIDWRTKHHLGLIDRLLFDWVVLLFNRRGHLEKILWAQQKKRTEASTEWIPNLKIRKAHASAEVLRQLRKPLSLVIEFQVWCGEVSQFYQSNQSSLFTPSAWDSPQLPLSS